MSEQKKVSYKDLYPEYAEYVDNPDITNGPVQISKLYDILTEWEQEKYFPYGSFVPDFLLSIAKWARRIEKYESYESHCFDNYDVENSDKNTTLLIKAIEYKLVVLPTREERCNFLLAINKQIDQSNFFAGLHYINYDEIRDFVIAELEYWKNLKETEASDTSKTPPRRLTHKKVMLLFHYLGLLEKIEALGLKKEIEAKIVSDMIGYNEKNTQTFIANMSLTRYEADDDVAKTFKNLEYMKKYFNDMGLTGLIDKVDKDIGRSEADKN